jgi:hypothetical protein
VSFFCLPSRRPLTSPSTGRTPALVILHTGFTIAPLGIQEAQMAFISSLFKPSSPPSSRPPLSLHLYASSLLQIVRTALQSLQPQLRVLACGILASPILAELDVDLLPLDPFAEGLRLAADEDATVRAAAARALGLLVKSPLFSSVRSSLTRSCFLRAPAKWKAFIGHHAAPEHHRHSHARMRGSRLGSLVGKLVSS